MVCTVLPGHFLDIQLPECTKIYSSSSHHSGRCHYDIKRHMPQLYWVAWFPYVLFPWLKLNSYSNASVFLSLCDELQCFHSDSNATTSDKMLMQSIFRWPIESCVTSVYRSWSWTFFNSCCDIAFEVAFWYRSIGKTLLTSKNRNAHATKR